MGKLVGQFSVMRSLRACIPWRHSGSTTSSSGFSLPDDGSVPRKEINIVSVLKITVYQKLCLTSYDIGVTIMCMYWHLYLSPTPKVFLGDKGANQGGYHKHTLEESSNELNFDKVARFFPCTQSWKIPCLTSQPYTLHEAGEASGPPRSPPLLHLPCPSPQRKACKLKPRYSGPSLNYLLTCLQRQILIKSYWRVLAGGS